MEERTAPLISLVIPVYNAERTVENTVNSVLEQPNADLVEVILVDDGSRDSSPQICDRLSETHPNVRVFHKENGGVSSARNLGIDHASGKYLAVLDSDDWWEPGFLSDDLAARLMGPENPDLYSFSYQKVSPSKRWVRAYRVKNEARRFETPDRSHFNEQSHAAFLFSLEYLNRMGFRYSPTKVWEDRLFTELCCTFAKTFVSIDRIMFSYWMNTNSVMHTKSGEETFLEYYKAERLAHSVFSAHGMPYDLDRSIMTIITECLKYISEERSYGYVKKLMKTEEFSLLKNTDVQPWPQHLQRDAALWRSKPFSAFAKYKVSRAPVRLIKKVLSATPLTRPLAEYLQYRVIEKWGPYGKQNS